jgi:uncharacterized protein (TIGR03067 family)
MNLRTLFLAAIVTLPSCTRLQSAPQARLAASSTAPTTSPSNLSDLQGKWRVESADSGDPLVTGDHPWSLTDLTIFADSYTVRRADGSTEQGAFSIDASSKPKKVLFFNWGHKDDPRKAVFELKGNTLRLCMYTKDFGDYNCTAVTPPKVKLPPASDPAYNDTVLYTFTRD